MQGEHLCPVRRGKDGKMRLKSDDLRDGTDSGFFGSSIFLCNLDIVQIDLMI